jgi:hypothetical protein
MTTIDLCGGSRSRDAQRSADLTQSKHAAGIPMPEASQLALSAASLTAEEVATCYRNGVTFTDLSILVVAPGRTYGD